MSAPISARIDSAVFADAGDRGQQFDLAAIRLHEFVDAGVEPAVDRLYTK
ncbi:hypothetical protein [Rhodococcus sp. MS16]|nr:hypothetical protein [Rhodococcus sp. MS16]